MRRTTLLPVLLLCLAGTTLGADYAPIPRKLPPPGVPIPADEQQKLEAVLAKVSARIKTLAAWPEVADLLADVQVYEKAVHYALVHGEFYGAKAAAPKPGAKPAAAPAKPATNAPPRGIAMAHDLLKSASARLDALEKGQHPWTTARGQIVRGYISDVDGSPQPYGLEIPDDVDVSKPTPLVIWLHGRGDEATDLYFIKGRDGGKRGELQPKGAIVMHAFGRQCVGWKSAGEIDVLEAIASVKKRYSIDDNRILLAGFSMGGAGTWHIGAHYADRWCCVHPGAGFIDVKRYQNVDPAKTPAAERILWGVYDVPDYVMNLFNVPVVSYSGENDKQRASANIMAETFKQYGHELKQYIGPKVEHKWLPLPDMLKELDEHLREGRNPYPRHVQLQTRTLRYNRMFWVEVTGLANHWEDSRVDATAADAGGIQVKTQNIASLRLHSPWPQHAGAAANQGSTSVIIDGESLSIPRTSLDSSGAAFSQIGGKWHVVKEPDTALRKRPGLQGPIDDAFMSAFLFVAPSGKAASPAVQKWADFEMKHQQDRWRALMRGDVRLKKDTEVTPDDIQKYNLICWGDARSNKVIAQMGDKLPARWNGNKLSFNGKAYDAAVDVPALIYPNPLNPAKYVVLNSGLTFREGHDGTNSLQNPKLGDWAIINVNNAPSDKLPGGVLENGFFDESWQVKAPAK
jgi:dienelactone hydrolase